MSNLEIKYEEPEDRPIESITYSDVQDDELTIYSSAVRNGMFFKTHNSVGVFVSESDIDELIGAISELRCQLR